MLPCIGEDGSAARAGGAADSHHDTHRKAADRPRDRHQAPRRSGDLAFREHRVPAPRRRDRLLRPRLHRERHHRAARRGNAPQGKRAALPAHLRARRLGHGAHRHGPALHPREPAPVRDPRLFGGGAPPAHRAADLASRRPRHHQRAAPASLQGRDRPHRAREALPAQGRLGGLGALHHDGRARREGRAALRDRGLRGHHAAARDAAAPARERGALSPDLRARRLGHRPRARWALRAREPQPVRDLRLRRGRAPRKACEGAFASRGPRRLGRPARAHPARRGGIGALREALPPRRRRGDLVPKSPSRWCATCTACRNTKSPSSTRSPTARRPKPGCARRTKS